MKIRSLALGHPRKMQTVRLQSRGTRVSGGGARKDLLEGVASSVQR